MPKHRPTVRLRAFLACCALLAAVAFETAGTLHAEAADASRGAIEGVVIYKADAKVPWRYQRYYVKDARQGFLAEAVVGLDERRLADDRQREPSTHVMDQKDFRFVPETLAIRAGDRVKFTNSDGVAHNVSSGDLTPFNITTPPDGAYTQEFPRSGGLARPVRIGCVYHSSMQAWIYVFDHDHFAVTPETGAFRLENVPPGSYRLITVHPSGGLRDSRFITVRAGETTAVQIQLTPANLTRRN